MTGATLQRFLGKEVNVFSGYPNGEGDKIYLGGGYVMGIEDDCLLLAATEGGEVVEVIALSAAAVVSVLHEAPELQAMDGGKVTPLRPDAPPEPAA